VCIYTRERSGEEKEEEEEEGKEDYYFTLSEKEIRVITLRSLWSVPLV